MKIFETKPKAWGNSLGVTIPKEILAQENLTKEDKIKVAILTSKDVSQVFGTLKRKKSIEEVMKEIDPK